DAVTVTRSTLGECPVWDERAQALYYVDIDAPALFRLDTATGAERRWDLPAKIGSFALDGGDGAVLALAGGFARFDLATAALTPLANPLAAGGELRFNDGAADPAGRFWAGSMHLSTRRRTGTVYSLDGGVARPVYDGFFVPNGFAWSPDGARFYV